MHCAIRNKNAKRNKICLTNTEETLDEGRFLEQKLGKHECRHQHISCGPDLTLDRNKNPGHCLQSQHFDEQLQSTVLYIDCRSTKTKTQTWEKLQPTIVKATDEYLAKTGRGWQKAQCWWTVDHQFEPTPGKHQEKPASVSMILPLRTRQANPRNFVPTGIDVSNVTDTTKGRREARTKLFCNLPKTCLNHPRVTQRRKMTRPSHISMSFELVFWCLPKNDCYNP